jgi:hypothetical protein
MPTEPSLPSSTLSVSEILNALEIDCGSDAREPERYLAIPGNYGPRWLVPAASRASGPALSTWRPYAIPSRMKWFAIRMAAHAGLLRFVPSVSSVAASRQGALRWFERCGIRSQRGELAILVGNPSPDRKLIVFLLDDEHRIAAVLKVGLTAGGGVSVLHEAETLKRLDQHQWAPRLLSVHTELRAAAQAYVDGAMPDRGFRPEYLDLLCQMPRTGGCKKLSEVAGELANRLSPYNAGLDQIAPGLLSRSLDRLDLDVDLPTLLVHGDFVPWNIRRNAEAGSVLVDWEWANFAGLPAYDVLHFQFTDGRLFGGRNGGYAAIRTKPVCAEYFRRMDVDPGLLPQLATVYLLDSLKIECDHCWPRQSPYAAYLMCQLNMTVDSPS